ncbi:MAG: PilZ domain-containing protein [Bacteriovoracaceae bacterium]|nr:PilZ domain-containing protein [Bacteriovoracaceae bacterium]
MKTKPLFFTVMPAIFLMLALALPVQIALIYQINIFDLTGIFSKLTPLNICLMGMFAWVSFATFKYDKSLFVLLPFVNLAVFVNNYVVGSFGEDFSIFETTVGSTAFLALSVSFYSKSIYRVFNEQNYRWWLSVPRKKLSVPLTIHTSANTIKTKSFDVSETGIFAITDNEFGLFKTAKNQEIELSIHLNDKILQCKGKIVRKSLQKGAYPEGVGIQFSQVDGQLPIWLESQAA